jgi:Fic family protein
MEREQFTPTAPGELVLLPAYGTWSFVPARLPPELALSRELLQAVEAARGAVGELVGQARLVANVELIIRALSRREAVLSSRLEGTHTQMLDILVHEATAPAVEPTDQDLAEGLNLLSTIDLAMAWFSEGRSLDASLVKELHARLLRDVRGQDKRPGALRTRDVYIGDRGRGFAGARFVPPPVEQVNGLVEDLLAFLAGPPVYGPLIDAAIAHYQFETIHPFEDGNGRIGRLLVALQLLGRKVLDRPLLYIGPYMEAHEDGYRDGLLRVSTKGDWSGWLAFFLEAIRATATDASDRVHRIMGLQDTYRQLMRTHSRSRFALPALDVVFEQVLVSVGDLERKLRTTAPTAKSVIVDLVECGIVHSHGRVRGREYWVARELLEQVYE